MTVTAGFDISALDPGFKAHAQRGIGRYVRELKRYFDSLAHGSPKAGQDISIRYFSRSEMGNFGPMPLRLASKAAEFLPIGKTTFTQQLLFPFQLGSLKTGETKKFDFVHFPAHMDAPAWGLKGYVLTVLDLIPLVCADLYKANKSGARYHFARFLELQAIKNASLCLCISENTARDVNRILNVPWERLVVTPLGVDKKFFDENPCSDPGSLLERYGIPQARPLVLYVGGIDPRKNYPVMLKAFRELLRNEVSKGRPEPALVLAGNIASDREFPRLQSLIKELNLEGAVFTAGFVADADLLQLYRLCRCFFFPSLYEGFGLPPLEAMAAGLPVVSSSSSAMPEVLGDCALLFNPHRVNEAAQALITLFSEKGLDQSLSGKGRERARSFTWDKTGELTLKAYERMAAQ